MVMLESQLKSQQQGDSNKIVWVERRTKKKQHITKSLKLYVKFVNKMKGEVKNICVSF